MEPLTPLWIATAPGTTFDAVADPLDVDVAVLGGGIAGLTTALLLQEQGADVAVIDSDRIGLGATARATVKVTAGHGLRYAQIARRHGEDAAPHLRRGERRRDRFHRKHRDPARHRLLVRASAPHRVRRGRADSPTAPGGGRARTQDRPTGVIRTVIRSPARRCGLSRDG